MLPIPSGEIGAAICEKYMKVEEWEKDYFLKTSEIKRISRYTGLNFKEVENLSLYDYLLYSHDSWVDSWNHSKDGREFLKTLWRLKQTEADEKAIKEFNRKEG